jgi:hypothetical protein
MNLRWITPTQRVKHMSYLKTTIALIAWLVWGGDKKTADEIGRDEYFSVIGLIIFLTFIYFIMEYL